MKDVLLKTLLLDNMFGLILIIWFTFDVVTKKMIIPNLREKNFEKMTPEMVDNIIKILIGCFLLIYIVAVTIPSAKDFIANKSIVTYGLVQDVSTSRGGSIDILTDDGKEIHLNLREQVYAKKGDYVKVEYLPNTRRGTIYY